MCRVHAYIPSRSQHIFILCVTFYCISLFLHSFSYMYLCFVCVHVYSYVPTIFSAIHQFPLQHWKLQHKFLFDMCKSLVYIFTYICINMQFSCLYEGRDTHEGKEEISPHLWRLKEMWQSFRSWIRRMCPSIWKMTELFVYNL